MRKPIFRFQSYGIPSRSPPFANRWAGGMGLRFRSRWGGAAARTTRFPLIPRAGLTSAPRLIGPRSWG